MSKTIRAIVKRALRLSGVADAREDPDSDEAADGLEAFKGLLGSFPGRGIGGKLSDLEVTSSQSTTRPTRDYQRLVMRHTSAVSVYLPKAPQDGARVGIIDPTRVFASANVTVNRNGWLLQGAAANLTLSTAGDERVWFFRADLGDWKRIDPTTIAALTLDDVHPYPDEFDDVMDNLLAAYLCGEYGEQPTAMIAEAAESGENRLKARYMPRIAAVPDLAVRCLPGDVGRYGY